MGGEVALIALNRVALGGAAMNAEDSTPVTG